MESPGGCRYDVETELSYAMRVMQGEGLEVGSGDVLRLGQRLEQRHCFCEEDG